MNKKGFTLIELMVVVAVIAILATIALYGLGKAQAGARDVQRQENMNATRIALERYYANAGYYPGVTVGTPWTSLMTDLVGSLPTAPLDPCGGGTAIPATGIMANCTPAAYAYAPTTSAGGACTTALVNCAKYTLTLTKEGSGTNTWTEPK